MKIQSPIAEYAVFLAQAPPLASQIPSVLHVQLVALSAVAHVEAIFAQAVPATLTVHIELYA